MLSLEPKCSGSVPSATDKVQGNLNRVKTQTQYTEIATFVKLCASVELAVSVCRLKPVTKCFHMNTFNEKNLIENGQFHQWESYSQYVIPPKPHNIYCS